MFCINVDWKLIGVLGIDGNIEAIGLCGTPKPIPGDIPHGLGMPIGCCWCGMNVWFGNGGKG